MSPFLRYPEAHGVRRLHVLGLACVVSLCACGDGSKAGQGAIDESGVGSAVGTAEVPRVEEAEPAESQTPSVPQWYGVFQGTNDEGNAEAAIEVSERAVRFVLLTYDGRTDCVGQLPNGVSGTMYRIELACGDDFELAGVHPVVSLFWRSRGEWDYTGSGAFEGLRGTLRPR